MKPVHSWLITAWDGFGRNLLLPISLAVLSSCSEPLAPKPGEIVGTCRFQATPELALRGPVKFRVTLTPNIFPDLQGGRKLEYAAYPTSDPSTKVIGTGDEDKNNPETYEFEIDFNQGGDWVIDLVATWPDGHPYRSERLTVHAIP